MQNASAPGDIPEWKAKLSSLTRSERYEMAIRLGVTERTVSNWTNGITNPNAVTIAAILRKGKR